MAEFFKHLFSSDGFMPHGHCYLWNPGVVWLHLVSDALIVLAYYSIPMTLVYFVHKRKDLEFHWMFVCFAVFIVACGTTHLMEIWNIWRPYYWLSGGIKAITALASVPTAVLLVNLVPRALALSGPGALQAANQQLRKEVSEREKAEQKFKGLLESAPDGIVIVKQAGSVVHEVAGALRPLAVNKGLQFEVTVPEAELVVRTDRRALNQIILNLANNAIKFTERGRVHILLRQGQTDERPITEISVEDSGIGIRPEDQSKLFDAFSQADVSLRRGCEGTGLGLHLSRKLAGLLGGQITFRSEFGKGSTFTLRLPG